MALILAVGEKIIKKGMANRFRDIGVADGGSLLLTNRRLHFAPHVLNLDRTADTWDLSEILAVSTRNLAGIAPTGLTLHFTMNRQATFSVFRRASWASAIRAAAPSVATASGGIASGVKDNVQHAPTRAHMVILAKVVLVAPLSQTLGFWIFQSDWAIWNRVANEARAAGTPYFPVRGFVFILLVIVIPTIIFKELYSGRLSSGAQLSDRQRVRYLVVFILVQMVMVPAALGYISGR